MLFLVPVTVTGLTVIVLMNLQINLIANLVLKVIKYGALIETWFLKKNI